MTIPSKVTSGLPPRLRWYVLAVVAAGLPVVTWAAVTVAGTHLDPRTAFGIAMFFSFSLIAELRPVPIDPAGNRNISLAFVFIIASLLLFGWQWAALIGAAGSASRWQSTSRARSRSSSTRAPMPSRPDSPASAAS